MCLESAKEYAPLFTQILHYMYNEDIIEEDAILSWEDEKKEADESDKVFVKQAQTFIQWLKEAPEEDDDEEE
ncbi:translation initiation factor eIF-2B subunit epsilon-like protein [Trifolium pratense]|uniref:Translation initiation factor eIF-2B subunit epsilon-like protein n=1 Tax=Trifolium pratense TaxID=57577 RepID=A0A2K3LAU6_TRIPR|nr:translation initiation factor eIF-2B subunit epsilon-like protein [Trifolium pratense]